MDLIETYLDAVAAQLPRDTRDDIVAELRDTLLSQVEEREDALGRPLTDDEREELVHAMGHPLVVGARYRAGPHLVIGPELFPYWLFAVKVGLLILVAVFALNLVAGLFGGLFNAGQAFGQSFSGLFGSGLTLIGAVTVAGVAMEHFGLRPAYFDTWRVKDLAMLRLGDPAAWAAEMANAVPNGARHRTGQPAGPRAPRQHRPAPWRMWPGAGALGSVIWGMVFVAWWVGALHLPGLVTLGVHREPLTIAPTAIWATLFTPILCYALAQIAVDAVGVVRPAAVRLRAILQIPVALAGAGLAWTAFQAGEWITLSRPGESATIRGGTAVLNPNIFDTLSRDTRTLSGLADSLGVIFTWVLVGITVALIFKALGSAWHALTGH